MRDFFDFIENLGERFPPEDDAEDLVGTTEDAPSRNLGGDRLEATNTNPSAEE
ncbi:hypothetical protein [Gordonia paraffinivorans]|uniref:hypothetical protein n=1 Tax=Gordonia paraffinivorans TaxID=175628 RepID=UPI001447647A|nr:hypothetical protein [Gordonia paraffinivorans]